MMVDDGDEQTDQNLKLEHRRVDEEERQAMNSWEFYQYNDLNQTSTEILV